MRLLFLDWPHLRLRLALGREPRRGESVVLGGRPWDAGSVLDSSPAARALGVRQGQALGVAHSLAPEATFLPVDPHALSGPLQAALEALGDLAPAVEGETDPGASAFGSVLVGIEGLHRLWGDELSLVRRALDLVRPAIRWAPRTGIGNTRFGAEVAARTGLGSIPVGGRSEEAAFLAPLPLELLPADPATLGRLRILGLTRMGELADLDRSAVIARSGAIGGQLHDLVRGMDGRPLRPRRPVQRLRAEVELEPAVETLEPLRFVLHHLCGTLCEQLAARGVGAAHATLALSLEPLGRAAHPAIGGAPRPGASRYEQALPEPAAAADLLERLLMARLEAAPPPAPVAGMALELGGTAPEAGQQLTLFEPQLARAGRLEWQLRSLAIRFGSDRIQRARVEDQEALVAEQRFGWDPAVGG